MAGILFCDSKDCETQASKQASGHNNILWFI
jgi:hypothetical protein